MWACTGLTQHGIIGWAVCYRKCNTLLSAQKLLQTPPQQLDYMPSYLIQVLSGTIQHSSSILSKKKTKASILVISVKSFMDTIVFYSQKTIFPSTFHNPITLCIFITLLSKFEETNMPFKAIHLQVFIHRPVHTRLNLGESLKRNVGPHNIITFAINIQNNYFDFHNLDNLRVPAMGQAKIAKICNFWTFFQNPTKSLFASMDSGAKRCGSAC